jgi:hypothetical protein
MDPVVDIVKDKGARKGYLGLDSASSKLNHYTAYAVGYCTKSNESAQRSNKRENEPNQ